MCSANDHHGDVHAEVVDLEELRLGKVEHEDTQELGDGDSTHNLHHTNTPIEAVNLRRQ